MCAGAAGALCCDVRWVGNRQAGSRAKRGHPGAAALALHTLSTHESIGRRRSRALAGLRAQSKVCLALKRQRASEELPLLLDPTSVQHVRLQVRRVVQCVRACVRACACVLMCADVRVFKCACP